MGLPELERDVSLILQETFVMGLIDIETEVAMLGAAQVHEERAGTLARATCDTRRRYPAAPYGGAAVLAFASTRVRHHLAS